VGDVHNPHDWSGHRPQPVTDDPTRLTGTRAALLRALHRAGDPLTVPDIWDTASARLVVRAGFPAVATSGTAVAVSLGYPEGTVAPLADVLDTVAQIASDVPIPVIADLDRVPGVQARELVERLIATGVAGCTLHEGDPSWEHPADVDEQAAFLAAVRDAVRGSGADLVVNARIDSFVRVERSAPGDGRPGGHGDLLDAATADAAAADAAARARRYLAAGADCVRPAGIHRPGDIRRLVAATGGRVDVEFRADAAPTPPPFELARLGVARISFGHALRRAGLEELQTRLAHIRAGRRPPG